MSKKIIINSNFNVVNRVRNANESKTKEWIDYRIDVFMNYTLKCLKVQTNQDFITFIQYDDSTENLIKDALDKYDVLPNNVQFVRQSEFKNNILKYAEKYDQLYMMRLETDDIYHESSVQKLMDFNPKENTALLIFQNGYIYDSVKNTLVKIWYNCPPFYAFIYSAENMKKSIDKYCIPPYHMPFYYKYPNHEVIEGYNYLWHIHSQGHQTATSNLRYKSTDYLHVDIDNMIVDKTEVNRILEKFLGTMR